MARLRHPECRACPLAKKSPRNYVPPEGNIRTAKYVLIGESPGNDERRAGRPFVGQSGQVMEAVYSRAGVMREDCYITNAVKCHPPRNQTTDAMIEACRPVLMRELAGLEDRPREGVRLAVMGGAAKDALFPHMDKGVMYNRGWHTWHGKDVLLTPHPAYVLYNPGAFNILAIDSQRLARGPQPMPEPEVWLLVDERQIPRAVRWLKDNLEPGQYVSFDLETEQVNPWSDRVLLVQFGLDDTRVIEVSGPLAYTEAGKDFIEGFFRQDIRIVGHNLKFDLKFLRIQLGIETGEWNENWDDTILMHYALKETRPHGLKGLADEMYDTGNYDRELDEYLSGRGDNYGKVPKHVLAKYGAMDAVVTWKLATDFEQQLRDQDLYDKPYRWPLMYAFPTALHMSERGLKMNVEGMMKVKTEHIDPELERTREKMYKIAGKEFNPLSSKQVNKIMYDEIGMPIVRARTRSKAIVIEERSTAREVRDKWKAMHERGEGNIPDEGVELAELLGHYRHVQKMYGSYIKGWTKLIRSDGRVHPTFKLRGTVTGRLAVTDPPAQTIPSDPRDKWGMLVARNVVAEDGWVFLYADYSQAELRVAAAISEDEFMRNAYNSGEDVDYHSQVAESAFGPDYNITQRQGVKRFTFGWLYGGDAYGIAKDALMMDEHTARHFSQWWADKFQGIVKWRHEREKEMLERGYVEAPLSKRRRRFPFITDRNRVDAEHAAINMPVQSTASDLNLLTACRLDRKYYHTGYAYVVLSIHDATVLEVREDKAREVAREMNDVMVGLGKEYFPEIPFEAEVMMGHNLAELMEEVEEVKFDHDED